MHRSVLENAAYIKFASEAAVDVVAMEEMDRALAEKSEHVRTYKGKDLYGAEEQYLEIFPGITIDELQALSSSNATRYMEGGRIPYTAIVDPHTLAELEGMKGVKTPQELIDAITRHSRPLKAAHGKGVSRKTWTGLRKSLAEIDNLLAEAKIVKALDVLRRLAAETAREGDAVKSKVDAAEAAILDAAKARLDEIEAGGARGGRSDATAPPSNEAERGGRSDATALARALEGTPLAERAAALATK